jgi:hypothetical protein
MGRLGDEKICRFQILNSAIGIRHWMPTRKRIVIVIREKERINDEGRRGR